MNEHDLTDQFDRLAATIPTTDATSLEQVRRRAASRRRHRTISQVAGSLAGLGLLVAGVTQVFATVDEQPPAPQVGELDGDTVGPLIARASLCVKEFDCSELSDDEAFEHATRAIEDGQSTELLETVTPEEAAQELEDQQRDAYGEDDSRSPSDGYAEKIVATGGGEIVFQLLAAPNPAEILTDLLAEESIDRIQLGSQDAAPTRVGPSTEEADQQLGPPATQRTIEVPVTGTDRKATASLDRYEEGIYCLELTPINRCSELTIEQGLDAPPPAYSQGSEHTCTSAVAGTDVDHIEMYLDDETQLDVASTVLIEDLAIPTLHLACWEGDDPDRTITSRAYSDGELIEEQQNPIPQPSNLQ